MKDNTTAPNVSRVGSFTESKFGIASGEDLVYIFDILRNKLYSDKVLAVVREYTTNAMDANVEAGKPNRPIVVTAPTSMTPEFKVRDFGCGLSEDDVRNIYCMYGRSTKRNSNDFTGQLGLGSKSGFSYGDSFSITSFYNGTKTIYTAYIDETRLGSVAKVFESPTTEENGVEITIPVKSSDVNVFRSKISSTLRFFTVPPITHGGVSIETIERIFTGKNWIITNLPSSTYGYRNAFAVMGNIAYPIDAAQVFPDEVNKYWNTKNGGFKFLSGSVVINFPIGSLSIAASREELEYNAATIQELKKAGASGWSEFVSQLQTEMNKQKDGLHARTYISKINRVTNSAGWGNLAETLSWNGKALRSSIIPIDKGVQVEMFYCSGDRVRKTVSLNSIDINEETVNNGLIYLMDDPNGYTNKMNQVARNNVNKQCYLFKVKKVTDADGNEHDGEEWFTRYDFPKTALKKISEVVLQKKTYASKTRVMGKKGEIKVFSMNKTTNSWGVQSANFTESKIDKSEIKYYIKLFKFKPMILGSEIWCDNFNRLKKACEEYIGKFPAYHFVSSSDAERLEDEAVDLAEHVRNELLNNKKFVHKRNVYTNHSKVFEKIRHEYEFITNQAFEFRHTDSDKPFGKLIEFIKQHKNVKASWEDGSYNDIISYLFRSGSQDVDTSEIETMLKEVDSKYPLLKYIGKYGTNVKQYIDPVYHYVNMVDNQG